MNKRKNRTTWLAIIAVVIVATMVIGGTLALLNDNDDVTNTFTVGDVDITANEPNYDPDDSDDIEPGDSYPKDPTITNLDNDAYVRFIVEITNADGSAITDGTYKTYKVATDEPTYDPEEVVVGTDGYYKVQTVDGRWLVKTDNGTVDQADDDYAMEDVGYTAAVRLAKIWQTIYWLNSFGDSLAAATVDPIDVYYLEETGSDELSANLEAELANYYHVNQGLIEKTPADGATAYGEAFGAAVSGKYVFALEQALKKDEYVKLFDTIIIPTDWDAADLALLGDYNIKITTQAIQAANFASYEEAFDALNDLADAGNLYYGNATQATDAIHDDETGVVTTTAA
ncbi:MAG: M73 family metallopeptidase [Clostridium sp.]|jgi:predicted ribosomally synthesized peptide with SipW-like signal peptide|nr:M73 family metallopeptidase [Clostridium sp.]